jgi:hypothetical protein
MSEWISFKKRRPNEGDRVMLLSGSGDYATREVIKYIKPEQWHRRYTHWLAIPPDPLPELSVEDAADKGAEFIESILPALQGYKKLSAAATEAASLLPRLRAALESEE